MIITYTHQKNPNQRFRQDDADPIPSWAVDVQLEEVKIEERPIVTVDTESWNILLEERDACFLALKDIIRHQEMVAGTMSVNSSVLAIARPVVQKIEQRAKLS